MKGHAYHTYRLVSKDKTVLFEFKHNINGRKIYCGGVYAAVNFLHKNSKSKKGKVYSMIDVLKG